MDYFTGVRSRDVEAQIAALEARVGALEHISLKLNRKKRQYTDEQRAAIKARLLAGQESARKRREAEVIDIPIIHTENPKKVIKTEKAKKADHKT